jgi:ERF superfamily
MHQSSETIGAIATALAKAQAELVNPEKTLTATIVARNGERTFRYASLASGLDLIRKCLGQHEIAVVQSTAVDQGRIMLTTRLVHASGEWLSSLWPVCLGAEASAHMKGAALTYARRYALFTLVGIAGKDDLDAPEIVQPPEPPHTEQPGARKPNNGSMRSPLQPTLTPDQLAPLRDRLVQEISAIDTADALALWAHRSLKLKNTLTQQDAQAVEAAYLAKVEVCSEEPNVSEAPSPVAELPSQHKANRICRPQSLRWSHRLRNRSASAVGRTSPLWPLAAMPHLQGKSLRSAPPEDRPALILGTKGK